MFAQVRTTAVASLSQSRCRWRLFEFSAAGGRRPARQSRAHRLRTYTVRQPHERRNRIDGAWQRSSVAPRCLKLKVFHGSWQSAFSIYFRSSPWPMRIPASCGTATAVCNDQPFRLFARSLGEVFNS